jgi:hypothetical protein
LFYTDTMISPAEWPGVRFAVFPATQSGQPCLSLEMSYRFLEVDPEKPAVTADSLQNAKCSRLKKLLAICTQLNGGSNDVTVSFTASPLLNTSVPLNCAAISAQLLAWHDLEVKNTQATPATNPVVVMPLGSIPCDGKVSQLMQFQPTITVARTKADYCPQPTDLPQDTKLYQLIQSQVTTVTSATDLQKASTLSDQGQQRQDEFKAVAEQFQETIGSPKNLRTGFLRDQNNQHELWLIPDSLFPTAPDPGSYADWGFATPRPLATALGTESFQVPNFAGTCGSSDSCWNNYPLINQSVVDQDVDQLGRIALRLIETETSDLTVLMSPGNAGVMRSLLATREQIANQLATFGLSGAAGWLVPLLATPGDLDGAAITRIARDAFLSDLSSFYRVSTILQLPLTIPGDTSILTFEGTVQPTYTVGSGRTDASFSDVLVGGGDRKITIHYDLPPNVTDPGQISPLDSLTVNITHVQLPVKGTPPGANVFNQGPWLKLGQKYTLNWKGYPDSIPVAERIFPAKPVIQSVGSTLPWTDATGQANPPKINAANASLLPQWGWTVTLGLTAGTKDDTVHATVTYNGAAAMSAPLANRSLAAAWQPQTLLQSLFVLKLLQDNWKTPVTADQLNVLGQLTSFLAGILPSASLVEGCDGLSVSTTSLPSDVVTVSYPDTAVSTDGRQVMKGAITADTWGIVGGFNVTTLRAAGDAPNNQASLTGINPVRNFKVRLQLLRNEHFGSAKQPADCRLIYRCPPVESPLDTWPQNLWSPPLPALQFDMTGLTLQTALQAFFTGIFNNEDLTTMNIEVGMSLKWTKAQMTTVTPFCILPVDAPPVGGTATDVANFVFASCGELLGTSVTPPAETDSAAIRLRVKITVPTTSGGRTLLEIAAIDFPFHQTVSGKKKNAKKSARFKHDVHQSKRSHRPDVS